MTVGPVEAAVGAVIDANDKIWGTAFWVTPTMALTCEHVIAKCAGSKVRLAPAAQSDTVAVISIEQDEQLDLALLITEPVAAPVVPLPLSTVVTAGRTIASHGYPQNRPRSLFPKGDAMAPPGTVAGSTELTFKTVSNRVITIAGTAPDHGQSGGPAYDTSTCHVIGVLRLTNDEAGAGSVTYAIPIQTVVTRWPQLSYATSHDGGTGPVSPATTIPPVGLRARRRPIRQGSDVRLAERDKELALVRQALTLAPVATIVAEPARATVHGQPGIGKSALALEYAYQNLGEYSAVWWIDASSEVTTASSFRQFAQAIRIPTDGVEDPILRDRVIDHLNQRQRWLAIFDNAETQATVAQWLPPLGNGHILITSRSPANWTQPIPIGRLSDDAIEQWLLDATTPPGQSPTAAQTEAAKTLATQIDGLALAAAQAVAFIAETGTSLESYVSLYLSEHEQMLADGTMPEDHPDSVATTIAVATTSLGTKGHHHAVRLLDIIAYLAPDRIPRDLFTPKSLGARQSIDVERAIGHLRNYGLIEASQDNEINVHRLTQAVTRHRHQSSP